MKGTEVHWRSWGPSGLVPDGDLPNVSQQELLEVVTQREKTNIRSLAEVPEDLVVTRAISSRMERPKSLDPALLRGAWFPQLTEDFLLRLPGGFLGDNAVFDAERYYSFGSWWLGDQPDAWTLYADTREVRQIDAGISIASWCGNAFQHFILDSLPKLAGVIDLLETPELAHVKIVTHNEDAPTAQWFWKKLGLVDRLVQKPLNAKAGFVYQANLALFHFYSPSLGRYGLHPRHCLRPLQQRLGTLRPGTQDLVLYLHRPQVRSVGNEAPLLDRIRHELRGTGLELHVVERPLGLDDDRELFHRARIIVGPHGGAFANMIFAQPDTHIIEFLPIYRDYREGRDPRSVYWGLSQAAGMDYWTIEPDNYGHGTSDMLVNVDEVGHIVRRLVGRRHTWVAPVVRRSPATRRHKVLLFGQPGYRLPKLFEWTSHEAEATVDIAVAGDGDIIRQIERPGRKIAWMRESPAISVWQNVTAFVLENLEQVTEAYEVVLTPDRSLCELHPKIRYHPVDANLPWPWIPKERWMIYPKTRLCSMFASPKTMVQGHLIRHRWAERLKDQLDLFGGACGSPRIGGEGPHPDKSEGILPYMFNVAMENCRTDFYYTEKITDCFATGTVPVYWGTEAIGEIFDMDGIIPFDEDLSVDSLSADLYEEMMPAIRNNLETVRRLELSDDLLFRSYIAPSL